MNNRGIFVFHEGPDDQRFIRAVLIPELLNTYAWTETYQYATRRQKSVCSCINGIANLDCDYLFLTDQIPSPCITDRITKIVSKYQAVNPSKIIIVVMEIESWYLAGLSTQSQEDLGLSSVGKTDSTTKNDFDSLMPKSFDSRIDFMLEILKYYSLSIAAKNNRSFQYLLNTI